MCLLLFFVCVKCFPMDRLCLSVCFKCDLALILFVFRNSPYMLFVCVKCVCVLVVAWLCLAVFFPKCWCFVCMV